MKSGQPACAPPLRQPPWLLSDSLPLGGWGGGTREVTEDLLPVVLAHGPPGSTGLPPRPSEHPHFPAPVHFLVLCVSPRPLGALAGALTLLGTPGTDGWGTGRGGRPPEVTVGDEVRTALRRPGTEWRSQDSAEPLTAKPHGFPRSAHQQKGDTTATPGGGAGRGGRLPGGSGPGLTELHPGVG